MSAYKNWIEEKRSAYLYQVIAKYETDKNNKKMFLALASSAKKQAFLWEKELKKSESNIKFKPDFRTHFVSKLIVLLGVKRLRYILSAMKIRGMSVFNQEKISHPTYSNSQMGKLEQRHKALSYGGNLRAAVFGINDGLLSNMSLILGVAGASQDLHIIFLSGIAGLLAGAFSMGAGEYISVRSQRDLYEGQIELERHELELYPEEEAAELATIYRARGLPDYQAQTMAQLIVSKPKTALDTLAREELGINISDLASPWGAAISSFLSFSLGALIPLLPFLWGQYHGALYISVVLTAISLFIVGAIISLFTNKMALLSGLRMLLIGAVAGSVTYFIGSLF